mmetsp:Transcript_33837/g.61357  ORF Transcript_33837/g.61357 Transcript_33837/m.61357 type:complete len:204 (-) Transcript_33837:355-966(-)|eukprot:CAMPEP_0197709708 /NCGR_PEP_ID=MMETSP1338-20131121/128589_1 /TAXON_ID=43686 ORGANISM="Pelagodinium beii, Strain RCC1491" /NCGR_SAMPLE_ID=MMETSP1338 /ASSEMBLY_ACC=CAM_ASM_000754 /LENGTH=203 /DNA_ID=CAMNT_0043293643 /DNA_START=1956 /DNA_END=2567 /DNA_ORIENTATION=+
MCVIGGDMPRMWMLVIPGKSMPPLMLCSVHKDRACSSGHQAGRNANCFRMPPGFTSRATGPLVVIHSLVELLISILQHEVVAVHILVKVAGLFLLLATACLWAIVVNVSVVYAFLQDVFACDMTPVGFRFNLSLCMPSAVLSIGPSFDAVFRRYSLHLLIDHRITLNVFEKSDVFEKRSLTCSMFLLKVQKLMHRLLCRPLQR